MRTAAAGHYRGILEFSEEPIVSSDVEQLPYSSVFDSLATMVLGQNLVKIIAWFNNGWGYTHRAVEILRRFAEMDGKGSEVRS